MLEGGSVAVTGDDSVTSNKAVREMEVRVRELERPQLLSIRRFHPAILALVFVESALADPIAPAHVSRLLASFLFLDHLNDLFVGESRLHLSVLQVGRTLHKAGGDSGAQVSGSGSPGYRHRPGAGLRFARAL